MIVPFVRHEGPLAPPGMSKAQFQSITGCKTEGEALIEKVSTERLQLYVHLSVAFIINSKRHPFPFCS